MKIDVVTAALARPNVARLCVAMDLLKKFIIESGLVEVMVVFGRKYTMKRSPSIARSASNRGMIAMNVS